VIEAGGAEVVPQLLRHALVLAEHDARDHRAALAAEPGSDRRLEMSAQPVAEAGETAAAADDAPVVTPTQNRMDSAPRQPRPLVEPVVGGPRRAQPDAE
jgi:hypothetical protein